MHLLNIIVPIYQVEEYLEQCLSSLITSEKDNNYQVILIDDKGKDNSINIAEQYFERYPEIFKLIHHNENSGISAARNTGLESSESKYVMFIDSDDWLSINSIENILNSLKKYEPDLLIFDFSREWPDKSELISFNNEIETPTLLKNDNYFEIFSKLPVTSWGKVFKKDIIKPFTFTKGIIFEDVAVIPAVIYECKKIVYTQHAIYYYRQRAGSIMNENRGNPEHLLNAFSLLSEKRTKDNYKSLEFVTVKDLFINCRVAYRSNNLEKALSLLLQGTQWLNTNYPKWKENAHVQRKYGSSKWYFKLKLPIMLQLINFTWGKKLLLMHLNYESISLSKFLFNSTTMH